MLQPHRLAVEERVGPPCRVAGDDDAGRREPGFVADHTVADREAAFLEPVGHRDDPDADDDEIGVDDHTVREPNPFDPPVTFERLH